MIGRYNMFVVEPCNYASNVAYYRAVKKICDYKDWKSSREDKVNIKRLFAGMASGSMFMHSSFTSVGGTMDTHLISGIAYAAYLMGIEHMPKKTTYLKYLTSKPRKKNITKVVDEITDSFIHMSVPNWKRYLDHMDIPQNYYRVFAAITVNAVSIIFPFHYAKDILNWVAPRTLGKKDCHWLLKQYLPAVEESAKAINIPMIYKFFIFVKL